MTKQFDVSFQGVKKNVKVLMFTRSSKKCDAWHKKFLCTFPTLSPFSLLPCIQDLYVVSGCITQGPTRSLHLEVSTEVYQVHRVFCRKYRDAQAPGETEDQLTVMGTKWGSCLAQVSLFWSPTAFLACALCLHLPGQGLLVQGWFSTQAWPVRVPSQDF